MTPAQQGCARRTKEGLFIILYRNYTEAATELTGLRAFYVPNNKKKEVTLHKLFKWPQVRSGKAARRAGLWSQLCHGFSFTQHQALYKTAHCHSAPKLCTSHWCLTSHHLPVLLANKALWILMAFCWLLVATGCRWELLRTCEQMKTCTWFIILDTRTRYWPLWNLSISKATHRTPDRSLKNSSLNVLFKVDCWTWV